MSQEQGVRLLSCNYLSPGMPQGAYKVCGGGGGAGGGGRGEGVEGVEVRR